MTGTLSEYNVQILKATKLGFTPDGVPANAKWELLLSGARGVRITYYLHVSRTYSPTGNSGKEYQYAFRGDLYNRAGVRVAIDCYGQFKPLVGGEISTGDHVVVKMTKFPGTIEEEPSCDDNLPKTGWNDPRHRRTWGY